MYCFNVLEPLGRETLSLLQNTIVKSYTHIYLAVFVFLQISLPVTKCN